MLHGVFSTTNAGRSVPIGRLGELIQTVLSAQGIPRPVRLSRPPADIELRMKQGFMSGESATPASRPSIRVDATAWGA
jgi:hypothetical protein